MESCFGMPVPPTEMAPSPKDSTAIASLLPTARQLAYARVRADWDKDGRWTDDRSATLTLEAEEVYQVSMVRLREPVQGYVFYDKA
jgi:hypothetical protein